MPLDEQSVDAESSDLPDWLVGGPALDSGLPLMAGLPDLDNPDPPLMAGLPDLDNPDPPEEPAAPPAPPALGASVAPPDATPREVRRDWRFTRQSVSHLPTDGPDERSYRFHVSNTSRTRAFECAVEFSLPSGCSGFRASGSPKRTTAGLEWGLGTLSPGTRVELSVWLPLTDEAASLWYAPAAVSIATRPIASRSDLSDGAALVPAKQSVSGSTDVGDPVPEAVLANGTGFEHGARGRAPKEASVANLITESEHSGNGSHPPHRADTAAHGINGSTPDTPAASTPDQPGAIVASLQLSVTAPSRVELEDEFACRLAVANQTGKRIGQLQVRLPVPEELVFRGATSGGALSTEGDHVEWSIPDVAHGAVWEAEARFAGFAPGQARLGATVNGGDVPDGYAEARLECVIRSGAGGTTLAAILAGLALPAPASEGLTVAAAVRSGERHLVVRAAHARLALPLCNVRDVLRPLPLTPLPGVPEWVAGVANVRGEVVTVIDLAGFLDLGDAASPRGLIVAQGNGGCVLGLLVDDVAGIGPVTADAQPPVENRLSGFLAGVGTDAGGIVHRLAVVELLSAVEAELGDPVPA